jgi:hypothetical protein
MGELRTFATCCALLLTAPLSLTAGEHISSKSPDGKFGLRTNLTEFVPSHGDAAIIEVATNKVAVQLHGDEPAGSEKLVWSKDSQRIASFRDDWQNGTTRIFFRNGATFEEIKMPELPSPELPNLPKPEASNNETHRTGSLVGVWRFAFGKRIAKQSRRTGRASDHAGVRTK